MFSFFALLAHTVALRPYVFVFFLVYLVGCSFHLGLKRALLFGAAGYFITWLSEYSSIHNGFPYGLYYYIDQTRNKEVWVMGVPLMDSMSYVFLAYASYTMALMVISPVLFSRGIMYLLETKKIRGSLYAAILGALFMVYLDIIIDPVALRGGRWFLGQIYGYPSGGVYFGVPISNFGGWFLTGFLLIFALQKIDKYLDIAKVRDYYGRRYRWRYLVGPALYVGVLCFNLWVTFSIGEYNLGWAGLFITLMPAALIFSAIKVKLSHADLIPTDVESHLRDFPDAVLPLTLNRNGIGHAEKRHRIGR
jgi:uncharacterized membrane protein